MKCVAAGDVFITPEMMKIALDKYPEIVTDVQYFFFGEIIGLGFFIFIINKYISSF